MIMATPQKFNKETADKNKEQAATSVQDASQSNRSSEQSSQQRGMARREPSYASRSNSPFSFMRRFSEEMDRLFDDFSLGGRGFSSGLGELGQTLWSPQIETFEREGQ